MIFKTLVHGLIAAAAIAAAGALWTEASYAQSSGYTATPNTDGSDSWGAAAAQECGDDDRGYVGHDDHGLGGSDGGDGND